MKARPAVILILALALTALWGALVPAVAASSRGFNGHAFLWAGGAQLNNDWDFSFRDEITGASRGFDLTDALKYGAQFDVNRYSGRGNLLPVNPFFAVYATDVSKSGFVSHPLPGGHYYTNRTEASMQTIELDAGIRYYGDEEGQTVVPFAGAGGALVSVDYSVVKTGTLVKLNPLTNLYDPVSSDTTTQAKKGTVFGVWGSVGVLWKPIWRLEIGVEAKYLRGLTKLDGKALNSMEFALLAGIGF